MSSLKLTYSDVYLAVAKYLGIQGTPTGSDLTTVQDRTKRGYRRFLMPIDSSNGKMHQWKFLEKTTTMSVQSDTDTYNLPKGFSSFVTGFTYTTPTAANPVQKSLGFILQRKSQFSSGSTGYPRFFAIQNGDYDTINGQLYKVVFHPTPSANLDYYYTYVFTPPALVEDNDVFVGDALASDAILESCLAVAEFMKYDSPNASNPGVHAAEAERLTQALIGKDKRDGLVTNLGKITNEPSMSYTYSSVVLNQDGNQILPEL